MPVFRSRAGTSWERHYNGRGCNILFADFHVAGAPHPEIYDNISDRAVYFGRK